FRSRSRLRVLRTDDELPPAETDEQRGEDDPRDRSPLGQRLLQLHELAPVVVVSVGAGAGAGAGGAAGAAPLFTDAEMVKEMSLPEPETELSVTPLRSGTR